MKKDHWKGIALFVIALALALYSLRPVVASISSGPVIEIHRLFTAESITASSQATGSAINLSHYKSGYASIQLEATGAGTVKLECLLSNDGTVYVEPTGGVDIVATFGAASGPDTNGRDIYKIDFNGVMAKYMKIQATEDGGAATAVLTATLAIQ